MKDIVFLNYTIEILGDTGSFNISLSGIEEEKGLVFIIMNMKTEDKAIPDKLTLRWVLPNIEIHSKWSPDSAYNRGILPNWSNNGSKSKATSGAPVQILLNYKGVNSLTVAVSDALHPVEIKIGLIEETGELDCSISLFECAIEPMANYNLVIRLDKRAIPYYESLDQVRAWWEEMPGYEPLASTENTRMPMYSTWYSFHQNINSEVIISQCKLAKELGCESVLVDDGWQTEDNSRGYGFCGDWEVAASKIKDMPNLVKEVHGLGMKFILWFSVPFIGKHSNTWDRFKDKILDSKSNEYCVLDPRYPEVREYLINIYEKVTDIWDLDGLKLDFVDSFCLTEHANNVLGDGKDFSSVDEAVHKLLKDIIVKLRAKKPEFMIEFRQSYIGPLMRTYGNMFRASDVPNDSLGNRVRVIDTRLLAGNTAVHSDPLMWNYNDTVESVAMQILNVIYAVPQISVRINEISKTHYNMLRFLLKFWTDNKEVLLDGTLEPQHPEANYSSVTASTSSKMIATAYSCSVIIAAELKFEEIILINASYEKRLLFEAVMNYGKMKYRIYNCFGELVKQGNVKLNKAIHYFQVPPAGIIFLIKK